MICKEASMLAVGAGHPPSRAGSGLCGAGQSGSASPSPPLNYTSAPDNLPSRGAGGVTARCGSPTALSLVLRGATPALQTLGTLEAFDHLVGLLVVLHDLDYRADRAAQIEVREMELAILAF